MQDTDDNNSNNNDDNSIIYDNAPEQLIGLRSEERRVGKE